MSRLAKGQPITYDFLADLESKINQLTRRVNNLDKQDANETTNKNVQFAGPMLNSRNLMVFAGYRTIVTGSKTDISQNINFDTTFSQPPLVVVSIHTPQDKEGDANDTAYAYVTLGSITKTGFNARIKLTEQLSGNKDFRINYIAIGKASTT